MAKNKKPRKAHRPIPKLELLTRTFLPIQRAAQAAIDREPMSESQARDLGIAYHVAFDRMLRAGDEEAWNTVTCSLNIALVLAEHGLGKEYEPALVRALDGTFRAKLRAERTGRWAYDGDAINDIRDAFALHDEQMKIATVAEARAALAEVHRRIDAGNIYRTAA
jgi:hypothetical protein